MKNKVDTINDAIGLLAQVQRGETITLNGMHKITLGAREDAKPEDYEKAFQKLYDERDNLKTRIFHMTKQIY